MSAFILLIRKTFGGGRAETNCEDLCEAKVCKLVSISHGDLAESMEPCTMLLYIHLHEVLRYPALFFL